MKNTLRSILAILLLSTPEILPAANGKATLSSAIEEDTSHCALPSDSGENTQNASEPSYPSPSSLLNGDNLQAPEASPTKVGTPPAADGEDEEPEGVNTEPDEDNIAKPTETILTTSYTDITTGNDSISMLSYSMMEANVPYTLQIDSVPPLNFKPFKRRTPLDSPYAHPYSFTAKRPDWHRLWINTAVLGGAFVGTLFVLEMLPEDATSWNRAELQKVPLFKRWRDHVIKEGPEWDHDKFVFNYLLHPYAGAVYFMAARSNGFNAWQSLLYSTCISTIGWEFGIEAFMERPSIQDLFITPLVGSLIGEGFYKLKCNIVKNHYNLAGTPVLGNIVAFLIDPVNEVVGLFTGNPARKLPKKKATYGPDPKFTSSLRLFKGHTKVGLSMVYIF